VPREVRGAAHAREARGGPLDRGQQLGVQETGTREITLVDGQTRPEHVTGARARGVQLLQLRPRVVHVDEVWCDRRHPAEVVEPRGDQEPHAGRVEVGRRLHADVVVQHQPRQRHPQRDLVVFRLRCAGHGDHRPRAEVLHDDLLDVPVLAVQVTDGQQRVHALAHRLADADEQPRGERDAQLTGLARHAQALVGPLVGRLVVRHALLAQAWAHVLEHEPERDVHAGQPLHLLARQDAGVGVRQEPVLERQRAGPLEVVHGAGLAPGAQLRAIRPEARLGRVPQAEERLHAALEAGLVEALAQLGGRHGVLARVSRRPPEGAVVAVVAAQVGERQEHLGRERERPPEEPVSPRRCRLEHRRHARRIDGSEHVSVFRRERGTRAGRAERPTCGLGDGSHVLHPPDVPERLTGVTRSRPRCSRPPRPYFASVKSRSTCVRPRTNDELTISLRPPGFREMVSNVFSSVISVARSSRRARLAPKQKCEP
jgi:hypothetical protein